MKGQLLRGLVALLVMGAVAGLQAPNSREAIKRSREIVRREENREEFDQNMKKLENEIKNRPIKSSKGALKKAYKYIEQVASKGLKTKNKKAQRQLDKREKEIKKFAL